MRGECCPGEDVKRHNQKDWEQFRKKGHEYQYKFTAVWKKQSVLPYEWCYCKRSKQTRMLTAKNVEKVMMKMRQVPEMVSLLMHAVWNSKGSQKHVKSARSKCKAMTRYNDQPFYCTFNPINHNKNEYKKHMVLRIIPS